MISKAELIDVTKENAVIACLMADPELILDIDISSGVFHNPLTRDIFTVLSSLEKEKKLDFTPLQVVSAGKKCGIELSIDDLKTLRSLVKEDGVVELGSFESYVQDLKDTALRIQLFDAAERITNIACDQGISTTDAISIAEDAVMAVEDAVTGKVEPKQIEDDGLEFLEECKNRAVHGMDPGIMTGFRRFDQAVGGCRPGSLTVFGARAKTGKSLLALNIAWNVWKRYGNEVPILYLDTEMSMKEVRLRLWAIASGINSRDIERGNLTPAQWAKVDAAREETSKMPLYHMYMTSFTPNSVVRLAHKWKKAKGIGLLIYDYIKLPDETSLKAGQEWQMLGFLANTLKNTISGKLEIPTITFAQLNRQGVNQAKNGEPDETSIGGSDRIIHYCSTYAVFRKTSEAEMQRPITRESPEHARYGRYANRFMHIQCTRHGGDSAPPIPMFLDERDTRLSESADYIPFGSDKSLSVTVSEQLSRETDSVAGD